MARWVFDLENWRSLQSE